MVNFSIRKMSGIVRYFCLAKGVPTGSCSGNIDERMFGRRGRRQSEHGRGVIPSVTVLGSQIRFFVHVPPQAYDNRIYQDSRV